MDGAVCAYMYKIAVFLKQGKKGECEVCAVAGRELHI